MDGSKLIPDQLRRTLTIPRLPANRPCSPSRAVLYPPPRYNGLQQLAHPTPARTLLTPARAQESMQVANALWRLFRGLGGQRFNSGDALHQFLWQPVPLFQVFGAVIRDPHFSVRILPNKDLQG
jgi:hypothetical protein